jgi:hypothetical protein
MRRLFQSGVGLSMLSITNTSFVSVARNWSLARRGHSASSAGAAAEAVADAIPDATAGAVADSRK